MKHLKVRAVASVLLVAMAFVGCITEADKREYYEWAASDDWNGVVSVEEFKAKYREGWRERAEAKKAARLEREALEREYKEWLSSDDGPSSGKNVSMDEFKTKYKESWRERAESKKAARLEREALEREYKEWLSSDDGPSSGKNVSMDEFKAKYKEGWHERAEAKKAARLECEALEREYKEWLSSDDGPETGKTVSVEEFKLKYKEGWRGRAEAKRAAHLAVEKLRQERSALCDRIARATFLQIKKVYENNEKYVRPFLRKDRRHSREDWLKTWTGPRLDLSEEEKLVGDAVLSEFGTKYLPNAYANYEKARDAAMELQQVFNEEFPKPWTITSSNPKWGAFDKVLEKFAKVRTEYFLCRDELCHYWLAHRLGVLSAEDLAKIDSKKLAVSFLAENMELIGMRLLKTKPIDGKCCEFATKYAPESFTIYQKLEHELKELDKLLAEICEQCKQVDFARFDSLLCAAERKQNDLVRRLDILSQAFQAWHTEYRMTVKSSEDVAKVDHDTALRLKPFLETLPTYMKEPVQRAVISKRDMIAIPGKDYMIQGTEVTQLQWMFVMGNNPSRFKGLNNPVENVSWRDCQKFIEKLNAMPEVKASGLAFRLPTGVEWEYACRAGSTGDYCMLADGTEITRSNLGDVAWYCGNSNRKTHPVGQKKPNAFGLYDMHGNVCEWRDGFDWRGAGYVYYRGGGWHDWDSNCEAGHEYYNSPDCRLDWFGFRLATDTVKEKVERAADVKEIIQNMVAIPGQDYVICKYEVTQDIWEKVMGDNPSGFKGPNLPVECVSWNDCQEFIKKLNALPEVQESGFTYRLPTEKEWEYACRAGSTGDYCKLADGTEITSSNLGEVAWYCDNSNHKTHPVGQKKPNAFGLYDMHGNVWEWCEDLYQTGHSYRVHRGGSWINYSSYCQASDRNYYAPIRNSDIGFRLAATTARTTTSGPAVVSGQLTSGDKGKLVRVNNKTLYAVVKFEDSALDELLGSERNSPLPPHEMLVYRRVKDAGGKDAKKIIGRIRLRQWTPKTNYVTADIRGDWQQEPFEVNDVVCTD